MQRLRGKTKNSGVSMVGGCRILLLFCLCALFSSCSLENGEVYEVHPPTVASIMLISTIDGYITAIDTETGKDKWKFKEAPILESPVSIQQGFTFIPNPRDGQLYLVVEGRLSKLPFTIPQLVKVSPCRSNDGILYAGNKKDVWMAINPETGQRTETFSSPTSNSYCPVSDPNTVFIGKTEYHLSMLDTKKKDRQWNATFVDYSSHLLPAESQYPFQHFTSSADGSLLTVDGLTGEVLWERQFNSVIVNMYLLKEDGMHKLPNTAIGKETFDALIGNTKGKQWTDDLLHAQNVHESSNQPKHLFPTLFVGQSQEAGLYALPAFVDEKTITIAPKYLGPPLLEGPTPIEMDTSEAAKNMPRTRPILPSNSELFGTTYKTVDREYLLLGYHEPPTLIAKHLMVRTMDMEQQLGPQRQLPFLDYYRDYSSFLEEGEEREEDGQCEGGQCSRLAGRLPNSRSKRLLIADSNKSNNQGGSGLDEDDWTLTFILQIIWLKYPYQVASFAVFFIAFAFVLVWWCGRNSGLNHYYSRSVSNTEVSHPSRSSRGSGRGTSVGSYGSTIRSFFWRDSMDKLLGDGEDEKQAIQVGNSKLLYYPKQSIGQGCEGTIVFRGEFDGRECAVKRVIAEFVELIDREINHLKESDSHPNVIRYFCSESDDLFRYIALELCECNLDDYVRKPGRSANYNVTALEILKQASDGIAHLHSIKIVHRDVKPKNILLTKKANTETVRILISDFGLCKKIKLGHNSISKMSGVAGTEGWMAPECVNPHSDCSLTCAVDVFSLGCIFYFVLTGGDHPFGEIIRRQDSILHGQYNIQKLKDNADYAALSLVEPMIALKASRRPPANAVALHPLFWSKERQLQFLMDVSDRIEKEDDQSLPVQRLERGNLLVVTRNWLDRLSKPLQEDLTKFRSYKRYSVRDLLRAMRNKKHHYNELCKELRDSLGSIPNEYLDYFVTKFPELLMHVYKAMTVCAEESIFLGYYPADLKAFYQRLVAEELDQHLSTYTQRSSPQRYLANSHAGLLLAKSQPYFQRIANPTASPPTLHFASAAQLLPGDKTQMSPTPSTSNTLLDEDWRRLGSSDKSPSPISPTANSPATIVQKKNNKRKKKKASFTTLPEVEMVKLESKGEEGTRSEEEARNDAVRFELVDVAGAVKDETGDLIMAGTVAHQETLDDV